MIWEIVHRRGAKADGAWLGTGPWTFVAVTEHKELGTPVVPFCPLYLGILLKLNSRKKGTLIINGLLENLGSALRE